MSDAISLPQATPDRYNGQVFLVPTNSWQFAAWAAARSSRFPRGPFPETYESRCHSPVLWYTPNAQLSDEVYDFLHRLPYIGRVVVFQRTKEDGLRDIDKSNLKAMLDDWDESGCDSLFGTWPAEEGYLELPLGGTDPGATSPRAKEWLNAHVQLREKEKEPEQRFPRVVLVVPATAQYACVLAPLAAYVQGVFVFLPLRTGEDKDLIDAVVSSVFKEMQTDEIWLVGTATRLRAKLMEALENEFDRKAAVRLIPGTNHFAVAEKVGVLLLSYRYLDWMLVKALTHPSGRECFFSFLGSRSMRGLFHYCNSVLDLADQLRRKNYAALHDLHELYWRMSDGERQEFVRYFRAVPEYAEAVGDALAVVADYESTRVLPHHLLDAAAFAARRRAPLLLLNPLPAETSYYVGSLIDKIDDRLKAFSQLQTDLAGERSRFYETPETPTRLNPATTTNGGEAWDEDEARQARQRQISTLRKRLLELQSDLSYHVTKTGEVLYESLVPWAIRSTLDHLQPEYLAVFIEDPSLPVELIRETSPDGRSNQQSQTDKPPAAAVDGAFHMSEDLRRFWSLRYAIGHLSGVNLYETNLTSNISFFTEPAGVSLDDVHILLCSNPTRDLFFSGQEAARIAERFSGEGPVSAPSDPVRPGLVTPKALDHLQRESPSEEDRPTRANLIAALRRGYDIVHYSGHAFFDNVLPGRSGLVLSDGVLTAADVRYLIDFSRRPTIYANACLAGRIKSVSSRFTGLAAAFIYSGAAGCISPLWSIDDRDASVLALSYYDALLGRLLPIGKCLQLAKLSQAVSGSITWAAYVLYGDPTVRIIHADKPKRRQSEDEE